MIYLYAVTRPAAARTLRGQLETERLRTVRCEPLLAVVGDHADDGRPEATEERLWEHERVMEALMDRCDLLPARFGTVLDSDAALADLLQARAPSLKRALDRVSGHVELAVRACLSSGEQPARPLPGDAAATEPGTAYIEGLLTRRRLAEGPAQRIHEGLSSLSTASVKITLPTPAQTMTGAYLVAKDDVERFRERVSALDREIAEAEIACTGPWPPYSFAEARQEATAR